MQKLIIKNFRQIPYAEIDVAKFTIFIGPQASGKSTIAKLIYFFKSFPNAYLTHILTSSYIKDGTYYSFLIERVEGDFNRFFPNSYHENLSIEYKFTENKTIKILPLNGALKLVIPNPFETEIINTIDTYSSEAKEVDRKVREARKTNDTEIGRTIFSLFRDKVRSIVEDLFSQHLRLSYIPASRNMAVRFSKWLRDNTNKQLGEGLITFDEYILSGFIDHCETVQFLFYENNPYSKEEKNGIDILFSDFSREVLRAQPVNVNRKDYFVSDINGIHTPIESASTGQQEALRILQGIYVHITRGEEVFHVYEEPEAHLFPQAQKRLVQLMAIMANKLNSQVIINTHSPYILTVINDLLYYTKVLQSNPNAKNEIEEYFGTANLDASKNERINFLKDEVRVYSLGDPDEDYCKQVVSEDGMIHENFLDKTSAEIQEDFDFLYSLYQVKIDL